MDREVAIRPAVACGLGYVLVPLWMVLAYKGTLTKNESTAIGFVLAVALAIVFSCPDVRAGTVIASVVLVVIGTLMFRVCTPLSLQTAQASRRIREEHGSRSQHESGGR